MLFGKVNTFWYTLQDAYPTTPNPSFGLVGSTLSTTPLFDLSCSGSSSSSSSSAASTSSATSVSKSVASATTPTTVPTSAASSVSENPVPGPSLGQSTTGSSAPSSSAAVSTGASSAAVSTVTGAATAVQAGETFTVYSTTLVTITSCSSVCKTTLYPSTSATSASASASASATSASASASASASGCPANLSGDYQYPHLIVPVSSSSPDTAYGTQYNGSITPEMSTIFNFDIPQSYAGKSCSLVFLFPELSALETSSYSFNGEGGIVSHVLSSAANATTTYNTAGKEVLENGSIASLQSGNSYTISSDSCPAGTTVTFELSSTGGLDLEFFEDYNPSPLGLYVVAC